MERKDLEEVLTGILESVETEGEFEGLVIIVQGYTKSGAIAAGNINYEFVMNAARQACQFHSEVGCEQSGNC